jgi:hypothetical protein
MDYRRLCGKPAEVRYQKKEEIKTDIAAQGKIRIGWFGQCVFVSFEKKKNADAFKADVEDAAAG